MKYLTYLTLLSFCASGSAAQILKNGLYKPSLLWVQSTCKGNVEGSDIYLKKTNETNSSLTFVDILIDVPPEEQPPEIPRVCALDDKRPGLFSCKFDNNSDLSSIGYDAFLTNPVTRNGFIKNKIEFRIVATDAVSCAGSDCEIVGTKFFGPGFTFPCSSKSIWNYKYVRPLSASEARVSKSAGKTSEIQISGKTISLSTSETTLSGESR